MVSAMSRWLRLVPALWALGACSNSAVPVEECGGNAALVNGVCRPLCPDGVGCVGGELCVEGICLPGGPARPDAGPGVDATGVHDDAMVVEVKDGEVEPEDAGQPDFGARDAAADASQPDADPPPPDGGPRRRADLRVRAVATLGPVLLVDETIPLAVTIENVGDLLSPGTQVALFINARGVRELRPDSVRVGSATVNSVVAGGDVVVTINARLMASMPPGERTAVVVVDPDETVNERDETNNLRPAGDVDITTITVSRENIAFGMVSSPCGSATQQLDIINRSSAVSVTVTSVAVMSTVFEVRGAMTPLTLPPNGRMEVTVAFSPMVPGAAAGLVTVAHGQAGSPIQVALTGTGIMGNQVDVFAPADLVRRADVVLVIDAGMPAGALQDLAGRAGSILQDLAMRGIDYRIAVMRAGGPPAGFVGTPEYMTPAVPAAELARRINAVGSIMPLLPVNEGFLEIEEAIDAMTPSLLPDSWVEFIAVTERDDASSVSPEALANEVVDSKLAEGVAAVSGIVVPSAMACGAGVQTTPRYASAISRTGGRVATACTRAWDPVLVDLGGERFGMPFAYQLSLAPDASTIQVTVGGVAVPNAGFSYDSGSNRVILHGTSVPLPGAGVQVTYAALCR